VVKPSSTRIGAFGGDQLLLWLALRPLPTAADPGSATRGRAVTLEICVLIGLPLNFANIVALRVAATRRRRLQIYYVTAWRSAVPICCRPV